MSAHRVAGLVLAAVLAVHGPGAYGAEPIAFTRQIVNIEVGKGRLTTDIPPTVRSAQDHGELWFGEIARQLPTDEVTSRAHYVPFAVEYRDGVVAKAWCDTNLNGDPFDDGNPELFSVAGASASRCFLVRLQWTADANEAPLPIDWALRIVLDELRPAPAFRVQSVYGMLGEVTVAGVRRLALLFDGNRDGVYTLGRSDGIFFDTDGDRHFTLDLMGPEFGPLALPFTVLGTSYRVRSIAPHGDLAVLEEVGPGVALDPPVPGRASPAFEHIDTEGRRVRLIDLAGRPAVIYFWGSWCGSCERQADALRRLYERSRVRGLAILGVSYDTDRTAMESFRNRHKHTWPTSFHGGLPAEDPVGRAFREAGAGVFYVISPNGVLVGKEYEVGNLESLLTRAIPTQ